MKGIVLIKLFPRDISIATQSLLHYFNSTAGSSRYVWEMISCNKRTTF